MSKQITRVSKCIGALSTVLVLASASAAVAEGSTGHVARHADATCTRHHRPGWPVCGSFAASHHRAAAAKKVVAPVVVASTAPCDNTGLTPTADNIPVVEAATMCLVNQVRGEHGLAAVAPNAALQNSAVQHNNDMINQDYFAHIGPAGDTPLNRIEAAGYIANRNSAFIVGENIAWGTEYLATPASIVSAWINSPDHLANILEADYTSASMAIAPEAPSSLSDGQQGAIYTQDFGGVDNSAS